MAPSLGLNSVTPNTSLIAGGIPVIVNGYGFPNTDPGLDVLFDGVSVGGVTDIDFYNLTCVIPAHIASFVNVQVVRTGLSSNVLVNGFQYVEVPELRQVVGGAFQDASGNPIADGYVTFRLSGDAAILGTTPKNQISAGIITKSSLDLNGNLSGVVPIWANDVMIPSDTVYIVKVYSASGELCWQSQQTIPSGSGTFDIGSWIPRY